MAYVRLKGLQVTLQRRKRGCYFVVCPRLRRWGLLPSLSLIFLTIAIASVGFFIITEVKFAKKPEGKTVAIIQPSSASRTSPTVYIPKDFHFKIAPLLNKGAPSVELSAQITLNKLYSLNNKEDVLIYYNWVRKKEESEENVYRVASNDTERRINFSLARKTSERQNWWSLKPCGLYPQYLFGRKKIPVNERLKIQNISPFILSGIRHGGWYEPPDCLARHSVAIVIPYKDRWHHLTTLLNYLHPLLQSQQLRYKLFVVEQYGNYTFNKGVIMNAAFLEALKEELFHCFIFHDVDLIPENDHNMYTCPEMPRHLSVAVNEFDYKLPYVILVGGAFAIRTDHYFQVNGYSNLYWGWGGEDDDMGIRVLQSGLKIIRPLPTIGTYTMIKHVKRRPSSALIRGRLLVTSKKRYRLEGLNSVKYKLISKKEYPWFTVFVVDAGKPHPSFQSKTQVR